MQGISVQGCGGNTPCNSKSLQTYRLHLNSDDIKPWPCSSHCVPLLYHPLDSGLPGSWNSSTSDSNNLSHILLCSDSAYLSILYFPFMYTLHLLHLCYPWLMAMFSVPYIRLPFMYVFDILNINLSNTVYSTSHSPTLNSKLVLWNSSFNPKLLTPLWLKLCSNIQMPNSEI